MEIQILMAGIELGPFSEKQIRQYLGDGLVSPFDLAMHKGMKNWESLDVVLARLSRPDPPSETISEDILSEELPTKPNHGIVPLPEPILVPKYKITKAPQPESAPPPAGTVMIPTSTQKTKRKPGKIMIQPMLPLEITTRKQAQTVTTATLIPPTPEAVSSPPANPVVAPMAREMSRAKAIIPPNQLMSGNVAEKKSSLPPAATSAVAIVPAVPRAIVPAPQPSSLPKKRKRESSKVLVKRLPPGVIYALGGLALLIINSICISFYKSSALPKTLSAGDSLKTDNAPTPPPQSEKVPSPEINPKTAADYSDRGWTRQARGDFDGAVSDYNQALGLDPKDAQSYYRRGLARQAKNDWNGALADYTQVLDLNPRYADAFSNRGFVKQSQGDLDGAIADYTQALFINPKIPSAYYNRGLIKEQRGDLDGAILDYDHALDIDPKMAVAYYYRGNAKNAEGNLDGAIADYTQALTFNPKLALAYSNRGFARQSKGDTEGALADYTQALVLNPKMAVAYYNRGLIKEQKGDLDGAIADATQAINLDPRNAQAYCNRGLARFGKDDLDEAMIDLTKFCELASRDNDADYARLYIWLISTEENPKGTADQQLNAAFQNDWNSTPEDLVSKIAAFLLGHLNENDLIANAASPDLSLDPGQHCKVWYFAGMKRLLAGDKATASDYFHKCLATEQKEYCEYTFAQAKLRTLKQ